MNLPKQLRPTHKNIHRIVIAVVVVGVLVCLAFVYRLYLWPKTVYFYHLLTDKEQVKAFVSSFGHTAPLVFILIQILQVLFAPFPGEATGFIGGYLFGTVNGFVYSSIGLTTGSLINFYVGRIIGKRFVRDLIPEKKLNRFDTIVKRQGVIVLFVLFIFPGFPKDYLCLFLGLSALPLKVFIILTGIGRMPGTLMLSLQGATVFEQRYGLFAMLVGLCLIIVYFSYKHKEAIYQFLERINGNK